MARIFITGSADGLGHMAARLLAAGGHGVVPPAARDPIVQDRLPGECARFGGIEFPA